MAPIIKQSAKKRLEVVFNSLKEKASISFKDWEETLKELNSLYFMIESLELSRDRWKERCLKAEAKLKEKKYSFNRLNL